MEWLLTFLLWFRWIPVLLIVLPLSRAMQAYSAAKRLLRRWVLRAPHRHADRVHDVAAQVKRLAAQGSRTLCSARPQLFMTTMRPTPYKQPSNGVSLAALRDVLWVDEQRALVCVEPLVTVEDLSCHLIPLGWTLAVMPELDDLTVGGLINGYGIESSSHKYGLFMDCVVELELVTGTGETVRCSRTDNADLFWSIPWSLGSVAFLVSATIRLIRCKPFVRVEYTPCASRAELVSRFASASTRADAPEFVEGLMFGPSHGVLITGNYSDNAEALPVNGLRSRWWSEWFFKQVEAVRSPRAEAIPLFDWLHRHTCSLFWEMELILPMGNHPLFRYLLGWLMPPQLALLKLTHTPTLQTFYETKHAAQDFLVPLEALDEALVRVHDLFEIYPLWLCPHLLVKTEPQGALRWRLDAKQPAGARDMYVDVGVYGVSRKAMRGERWSAPAAVAQYEQWLVANAGYSALYAVVELSRADYERMFDNTLVDAMRRKWGGDRVLCDAYEKIKRRR